MDYDYTGNFAAAPLGPFTNANKKLVWADPQATVNQDFDPDGTWYEIVKDDRFPGGRACRMKYGKGRVGMQDQSYQVRLASPQTVANLEFLLLFEPGFAFYNEDVANNTSGNGKLGPCIQLGPVGGTVDRGTRCMYWWNANGSNHAHPVLSPSCQDQETGNQLIQPIKYSKPIELDRVYKLRIQCQGGPEGWAKYWLDDVLLADTGIKNLMHDAQDDVFFDFAFFSGGSGNAYAPNHDCYTRHGGIRYWSGEAETGNGDGGTGEGGGDTGPTPPSGATLPFSLAVGETKIFRARFFDLSVSPAQEIPAGADIKWSLTPNNVKWGAEAGPNWSAIKVTGKTAGSCMLIATDPSSGLSTEPVQVGITEAPGPSKASIGYCTVEPA